MKIKVIDLLNTISKGEKVPKKIKFRNVIWNYERRRDTDFYNYQRAGDYLSRAYFLDNILNEEVEIIEEEKKIPEKLKQTLNRNDIGDDYYRYIMENRFTINQVIDYLNSKGE